VNVTGGEAGSGLNGGAIIAESDGAISVASGVTLLTKSDAHGGDGGDVSLDARGGTLTVGDATIDVRGDWSGSGEGTGAEVTLKGCGVSIGAGATVDARGYDGGSVLIAGRETLTVSGTSLVDVNGTGGDDGAIELAYRLPGRCNAGAPQACEFSHCQANPGHCSNDPNRQCAVNADCTIGCNTGTCLPSPSTCSTNAALPCSANADCTGCTSGSCVVGNPDTGGTTAQFQPPPSVTVSEDPHLGACDEGDES
jgi:hypothetical protein